MPTSIVTRAPDSSGDKGMPCDIAMDDNIVANPLISVALPVVVAVLNDPLGRFI